MFPPNTKALLKHFLQSVSSLLFINSIIVLGVRCKDGECLNADNVICNADPPSVYDKMLKNHAKSPFFKLKMARMEYSMGLFVYYFGTKKKYEN